MVLAAPEFVETQLVDLLHEIEVAAELQQRIFADRVMRGEEGAEFQACHGGFTPDYCFWNCQVPNYGVGRGKAILRARRQRMVVAQVWLPYRGPEFLVKSQ